MYPEAASLPRGLAGDNGRPWPDDGPHLNDIAREASSLRREKPVEVRLRLQRRAAANLRHHARRAVTRFAVLVAADLAVFALVRVVFRLLKDGALPGQPFSDAIRSALPGGYLNGWEFAVALMLGLLVTGNYGTGDRRRDAVRLLAACALATALPLWSAVWTRGLGPVLVQYLLTALAMWLAIFAERLTIDRLVAWFSQPAPVAMNTLFVGPASECARVAASPAFASDAEYRGVGFVDTANPPAPGALGHVGEFALLLEASEAKAVVMCGQLGNAHFEEIVEAALAAGCQLMSIPRTVETAGVHLSLVWRQGQPVMQLSAPSLHGQQLLLKRVVDVLGASLLLIVTAPIMLLVALAIKLDSRGSVLFGQERIGAGGRRFRVLKFRTMYNGVSDAAHRELVTQMLQGEDHHAARIGPEGEPVFKLTNDDRVTRVGRWLRRTSLDELPQLFNVLRGEMSLVGPRPPLDYEFDQYEHWQFHRLQVRPGITGLWQVSGRNRLSYRQMCELDLVYIRAWSLWLDLLILFKTIPVVLSNSGRAA
jgi:exopolysaccharide biosynthesis polyprenyl glycosylphosphotransferase